MFRRGLLKGALLAPLAGLGLFSAKEASAKPTSKGMPSLLHKDRKLLRWNIEAEISFKDMYELGVKQNFRCVQFPVECYLIIEFERIVDGVTQHTTEKYSAFNPGGAQIEEWMRTITDQDVINALNNPSGTNTYSLNEGVVTVPAIALCDCEFKLCSIEYDILFDDDGVFD